MTPLDIIRWAGREGIDLNVRAGRLFVHAPRPIPPDLRAAITTHKPAIITALAAWAANRTERERALARCRPLTPADLTPVERAEAEELARELADTGGLGQFVICLAGTWNELDVRDRLAACLAWQLAAAPAPLQDAA